MSKDIFEIRFHARAGQGAKSAAQLIVESALDQGKYIQAFPEYGPERAGAPMKSFARISKKPINNYAPVLEPNALVVIDPSILSTDIVKGLDKDGLILVNTCESPEWVKKQTGWKGKTHTIDATAISMNLLGDELPNTTMLGALVKLTNIVELKSLTDKVKKFFLAKGKNEAAQANVTAIKKGYAEIK